MRIRDIREATASIQSNIRNASIDFSDMTLSVVAIESDVVRDGERLIGFGFSSNGRYAQGEILRERFFPRIRAADPDELRNDETENFDPNKIWHCMMRNEKPGGHGDRAVAAAALDMAAWDLVAKVAGKPLWKILSERYNGGDYDEQVMVYPGGGYYYPGKDLEHLKDEIRGYKNQGYTVVKIKIGGVPLGQDLERIEAVLEIVGEGRRLAVDANGQFDLPSAILCGRALAQYSLFWYEEPGDPLDYELNAAVCDSYEGSIATGENLFSTADARNLILYGGMRSDRDWIQLDPALSYGLTEYLRFINMIEEAGWSRRQLIPHGGHQLALNMAAGLQIGGSESYPGVFQPFGGFGDDCEIKEGYASLHDTPGIGIELKRNMFTEIIRLVGR